MKALAMLEAVGNALILQLGFFVASLPIVTIAPAAIALQRSLTAASEGERTGFATFFRAFRSAWRETWVLGLMFAAASVGFIAGLSFWYSISSPVGVAGFFALVALLGFAIGVWISLLAVAASSPRLRSRELLAAGLGRLVAHPLRGLVGVILVLTWLFVELSVPTLILVGSGLVPALIVTYMVTPRAAV